MKLEHTLKDRFLRYVQVDTEADPFSDSSPSSEKQKNLSKIIVEELHDMGVTNAYTNEYGYIYASIPGNTDQEIPGIFFCAHLDTAPDVSGKDVKPIVHENYQGQDIVLPDDTTQVLTTTKYKHLAEKIGHDIITASGTTLLGSDDKSGVAIIMDAAYQLLHGASDVPRGPVSILFTTDEEIGRGTVHVEPEKVEAEYGYTLDGGPIGDYADENFSANSATLTIKGVSAHPGYAKGKMEHSMKIASKIIANLPSDSLAPEVTDGKQGFVHPVHIEGGLEETTVKFIIRDFDTSKLPGHLDVIQKIAEDVLKEYPNSSFTLESSEQYRNMQDIISQHPHITANALKAMERAGIKATQKPIRGGTDGATLSFKGLPCPNIFAAEYAIHSKHEWTSVQDMQKAVETIIHIVAIHAENHS